MNCEQFKELLLTDYLNEEMDDVRKSEMDLHMKECVTCQEFFDLVRKSVRDPFENADFLPVPESVWKNIQEEICAQKDENEGYTPVVIFSNTWNSLIRPMQTTGALVMMIVVLAILNIIAFSPLHQSLSSGDADEDVIAFLSNEYEDFFDDGISPNIDFFENI